MQTQRIKRVMAAAVFLISLIQFLSTVQPSVSFWDPGELSAAAYMLQVPHPPGGPLFSLVGRVFYMLPFPGDIGLRMNLVSVLASAVSVLLLFLCIVKVIESSRRGEPETTFDAVSTSMAAAIGALGLSFCDSFWFSAVESNYFAASTLLFALVTWLMFVWNEHADEQRNGRYLLLAAYLIGLSAGVHLMSVLAIVAVIMVVVFKRYVTDYSLCRQSAFVFLAHVILLMIVAALLWAGQTGKEPPFAEDAHAFDRKFEIAMLVVSGIFVAVFWKKVFNRSSFYFPVVAGGVGVAVAYPGIIKIFPALLRAIAGDNGEEGLVVLVVAVGILIAIAYLFAQRKQMMLHLAAVAMVLIIAGFTTYTMILIRSGKKPPMNENEPRTFSALITYLNREQYGDFPIFKRRWSMEDFQQGIYANYTSDLDFYWRYQMNHMFTRYLLWNFVGRVSDEQDAGVDFSRLWAIPLLLGFSGVYFHFRRDWKMASVLLVLFVFMGYLIAFYQNQQEPQPRERDYFYPGSFFVFAIWIALGVRGILDLIRDKLAGKRLMVPATVVTVILALLFVPVRMLFANYSTHDRSKNWLPWDFSYNLLQTCDKDAILFTNGDNDTFPLWYLQDVAGIRRDVRIVNLSLVNTPWYILQMKRKPYYPEAQAVPISLSDARIAAIQPVAWEPRQLTLPVPADVIVQYGNLDSTVVREGKISFLMRNTIQAGDTKGIRIQDEMVRDIVFTNAWRHPVYFATTCSPDSRIGLDDYLWYQGLAYRLEPRRVTREDAGVNEQKLKEDLLHEPQTFSRTPQDGFVFRGVADPHVFFDENASRMIYHYRMAFLRLVMFELNAKNDKATGLAALERMEEIMPRSKYPLGWEFASDIATFYYRLGKTDRFNELVPEIEQACQALIEGNRVNLNSYYNPYRVLLDIYEMKKDNAKTLELLRKLSVLFPNDPGIKQRIESLQVQMGSPSDTGSLHR